MRLVPLHRGDRRVPPGHRADAGVPQRGGRAAARADRHALALGRRGGAVQVGCS